MLGSMMTVLYSRPQIDVDPLVSELNKAGPLRRTVPHLGLALFHWLLDIKETMSSEEVSINIKG